MKKKLLFQRQNRRLVRANHLMNLSVNRQIPISLGADIQMAIGLISFLLRKRTLFRSQEFLTYNMKGMDSCGQSLGHLREIFIFQPLKSEDFGLDREI